MKQTFYERIGESVYRETLPNGLQIYTYARSLFDTSLSAEDIREDYFPYIYGDDWKEFLKFFEKVGTIFDFTYFQKRNSADERVSKFYNPEAAKRIEDLPEVLAFGRKLVDEHYNSDIRVQTVSVRLLEYYLELLEKLGEIVKFKAVGDDESAKELYNKFELDFGKYEPAIEKYFNQCFFFNFLNFMVFSNSSNMEFVL